MTQVQRTVKTLLLCKINPDSVCHSRSESCDNQSYETIYRGIYSGSTKNARKYITFGAFDAISIYDPVEDLHRNDWFYSIYEDKQRIIREISDRVSYHPVHLVSNTVQNTDVSKKRFCVISLIYGVNADKETHDLTEKISAYENTITSFLENNTKTGDHSFEVYNAINICDAVVILYSDNLPDALEISSQINRTGLARKTYTIVGCLMTPDGNVTPSIYNDFPKGEYRLRIQGSIRNHNFFMDNVYDPLKSLFKTKLQYPFQSFSSLGRDDFTILFPKMDGTGVAKLLLFLMTPSNGIKMAKGCWEIHTQFLTDGEYSIDSGYNHCPPSSILSDLYRDFLSQYGKREKLYKYPWFNPYMELLGVHATIDHHPVLYGLSYLLFDFFRVFDFYLSLENEEVLDKSKEKILHFMRNWSQHTDQMTRIDDLIFHGFGSTSVIYNTLPECALDFYHSFLKEFVDLLIDIDSLDNRVNHKEEYIYEFLLVPELSQRPRISSLFDTNVLYNNKRNDSCSDKKLCAECEQKDNCWRARLWPQKQAYLVEFPLESVYKPHILFCELVHECYHMFGDSFRLRDRRADHMAAFISMTCMVYLGLSEKENLYIYKEIFNKIKLSDDQQKREMHLKHTIIELQKNVSALFCYEGIKELYHNLCNNKQDAYFLYSDSFVDKWKAAENGLARIIYTRNNANSSWSNIMKDCEYYFKECYSDFVMILTLKLVPEEYYSLFQEELKHITGKNRNPGAAEIRLAQRIALVTAACSKNNFILNSRWSNNLCKNEIINNVLLSPISNYVSQVYCDLSGEHSSHAVHTLIHPAYVLKYVEDYLCAVANAFSKRISLLSHNTAIQWQSFQKRYIDFIKNGNFFSSKFFSTIRENHLKVRKLISKNAK